MKKSFCVLLSLLVVAMVAGCTTQSVENETVFVEDDTEIVDAAGNSSLIITEHRPSIGLDANETIAADINALSFIDEGTSLPTTIPFFVNEFPYGHGGPLFHIDERTIDRSRKNIDGFLKILYGRDVAPDLIVEHEYGRIYYDGFSETSIMSGPNHVSLFSSGHELVDNIINGNLLENRLVQYALEYMEIGDPEVTRRVIFNSINGEPDTYEYTIFERTNDFFEDVINANFSSVTVTHFHGSQSAHILMMKHDISNLHSSDGPIVPFADALEYVMITHGVEDRSRIHATIQYASDVDVGYFVPVYKFYVEIESPNIEFGSRGGGMYVIVRIPMPQTFHIAEMERSSEQ